MEVRFVILHPDDPAEVLHSTAVIRCLKAQVEDSLVYSLVREDLSWLLERNGHLDGIFTFREHPKERLDDLRDFLPDYLIDLDGGRGVRRFKNRLKVLDFSIRRKAIQGSWTAAALETCRLFDVADDGRGPEFTAPPGDMDLLPSEFTKGYLVIPLDDLSTVNGWSEEDVVNLAVMIEKPIVVTGPATQRDLADRISQLAGCAVFPTCGDLSREQIASLVGNARGVVPFDPFWGLMARALHIPVMVPGENGSADMAGLVRQARMPFEKTHARNSI